MAAAIEADGRIAWNGRDVTRPIAPDPRFHAWLLPARHMARPTALGGEQEVDRVAQELDGPALAGAAIRHAVAAAAAVIVLAGGTALVSRTSRGIRDHRDGRTQHPPDPVADAVPRPRHGWIGGPAVCTTRPRFRGWRFRRLVCQRCGAGLPACRLFSSRRSRSRTHPTAERADPLEVATGDFGLRAGARRSIGAA